MFNVLGLIKAIETHYPHKLLESDWINLTKKNLQLTLDDNDVSKVVSYVLDNCHQDIEIKEELNVNGRKERSFSFWPVPSFATQSRQDHTKDTITTTMNIETILRNRSQKGNTDAQIATLMNEIVHNVNRNTKYIKLSEFCSLFRERFGYFIPWIPLLDKLSLPRVPLPNGDYYISNSNKNLFGGLIESLLMKQPNGSLTALQICNEWKLQYPDLKPLNSYQFLYHLCNQCSELFWIKQEHKEWNADAVVGLQATNGTDVNAFARHVFTQLKNKPMEMSLLLESLAQMHSTPLDTLGELLMLPFVKLKRSTTHSHRPWMVQIRPEFQSLQDTRLLNRLVLHILYTMDVDSMRISQLQVNSYNALECISLPIKT
ncbi:hypothetical protein RFI_06224 [Reticulomyxa filosa]|uniref:Uncharacterized protein n=1 Tax=Reticulomyxa filosa TaxID=46433 RepID=X6NX72_RETFI|nr:hypothetical protein RFI_06224 [Reticulomyxa filosa]|eukprot:ETO30895.1 hypothetical protein RFI_06224 [Reticulomyxa filosa]